MERHRQKLSSLINRAERRTDAANRYLDLGVEIWTVAQDFADGIEVIPGLPPLVSRSAEPVRVGGIWDCVLSQFVGESRAPRQWYVGERHAEILFRELDLPFDSPPTGPTRTLLYSAEGGGKTGLLSQWLVLQVLSMADAGITGYGGATAPVGHRLKKLVDALCDRVPIDTYAEPNPNAWGRYHRSPTEHEIRFHCGVTLELRATKRYSEALGSPVQGSTWRFS